jgi:hypothetical protein
MGHAYLVIAAAAVVVVLLYVMHMRERRPRKTQAADAQARLAAATALFNASLERLRTEALAYKLYDMTIQLGLDSSCREHLFAAYGKVLTAPRLAYSAEFAAAGISVSVVEHIEREWLMAHGVKPGSAFDHGRQIVSVVLAEVAPHAASIIAGYQATP